GTVASCTPHDKCKSGDGVLVPLGRGCANHAHRGLFLLRRACRRLGVVVQHGHLVGAVAGARPRRVRELRAWLGGTRGVVVCVRDRTGVADARDRVLLGCAPGDASAVELSTVTRPSKSMRERWRAACPRGCRGRSAATSWFSTATMPQPM